MIFNQFEFLLLYLPTVLALFYIPAFRGMRPEILLVASLVFYAVSGLEHLVVLLLGIIWVYGATFSDRIIGSKWWLFLAAIPPVMALVYYKYASFLVRDVLALEPKIADETFNLFANVVLPAGISFFTFELVSYAIDRYRGEVRSAASFRSLALFISFFPHLVAGPILRFRQVADTIANLRSFRIEHSGVVTATGYIVFGLAAKVLLADTLGSHVKPLAAHPADLDTLSCVYLVFAYSFQIYFDFYGYSLIAIGLGKLFGFEFPDNFRRPYEALNPKEFWRRWHITLSAWLRDYLYIPLGGNVQYRRNILIVFAICGLWHGAGWTFVFWGVYHALLVIGYSYVGNGWDRMPSVFQVLLTFCLVSAGWTLFLFDFANAVTFGKSLLGFGAGSIPSPSAEMWLTLAAAAVVARFMNFEKLVQPQYRFGIRTVAFSGGLAALLISALLFVDRSEGFIYFRF